jgi:hypothetical protein
LAFPWPGDGWRQPLQESFTLLEELNASYYVSKAWRPRMVQRKKVPMELTAEEEWNKKISLVRGKIWAHIDGSRESSCLWTSPSMRVRKKHDCAVNIALACCWLAFGKE